MSIERAVLSFLDDLEGLNMHGFLLSLHGKTVAEGYWSPFTAEQPHRLFSVSKSAVSLAIGLLADDGALSLSDHIVDSFPEWVDEATPALLREVTIRDMLTMSTCYDAAQYRPLRDADWTRPFFFGQPTHPAGTLFSYDTSASQVMCALVERKTGQPVLSFLEKRLFAPLGMTDPKRWLTDRVGTSQGGTGLIMTLRDFAKLADFCMSDGRGLLSESYLRAATARQIDTGERSGPEERYGYGYQFWRMREGFSMYGLGGQMALCLPERGICLCTTADLTLDAPGVQPIYDAFFRRLSRVDELEHDEHDAAILRESLGSLRREPLCFAESNPEGNLRIELPQAGLPFDAVTISSETVSFRMPGGLYELACGNGQWLQGVFPATEERCVTSGGWRTKDRFELHCQLIGDFACSMRLFVALRDQRASVRVVGSVGELAAGWSGLAWGCIIANA